VVVMVVVVAAALVVYFSAGNSTTVHIPAMLSTFQVHNSDIKWITLKKILDFIRKIACMFSASVLKLSALSRLIARESS
jgi:hypothetical protein